ncbi:transcriptional repressor [Halobacillus andaensis]|uniref:Transcriptional repressor n=1 Tax=Halobacillus andaensis TaxID=1176239 RepID=A0A917EYY5_HALAA|nr:Fur family transcriptional regulator [Halobacillus andaensis]MBP2005957.1 Fur family zinc uptake transcriptional regulator [Halobacillus andaensis]GGF24724.1 transcriptional repressor [Halobacillus andaensis]
MNLETAIQKLKEKGYKKTRQRERILEIFVNQDQYIAAKTIIKEIQEDFPGVSYDTIYRNLYLLTDEEILESTELSGEKHFRLGCDTHGHHHHFICTDCGKTKPIDFCPMESINENLQGYDIENHKFEIYGKCPVCH